MTEGFHAFFGVRSALLIGVSAGEDLISTAGTAVHDGRALTDLLAALTAKGLHQTPDFACVVHTTETARVLVRGAFTASALDATGELTTASGEDVSTWVELLLPAASAVELSADGGPSVQVPAPIVDLSTFDVPAPMRTAQSRPEPAPAPVPDEPVPVAVAEPQPASTDSSSSTDTTSSTDSTMSNWTTSHGPIRPAAAAADDPFQHMFGHTEFFGAEAAAVRPVDAEAEVVPASAPADAAPPPPAPTPSVTSLVPAVSTGLIDSVPFGAPAVPATRPVTAPAPTPTEAHTVSRAEMLRLAGATPVDASAPSATPAGPQLQAVHCPVGHANNPTRDTCRTCGASIVDRTIVLIPRPILGKLRFADGLVHAVHRPVLMGRQPTSDAWTGGEEPQLLALPDPEGMLSRTHAELRISDWQLQVVDRGSTNGTVVTLPGRDPQTLREREPLLLAAGARVSLGGVVAFEFEESG